MKHFFFKTLIENGYVIKKKEAAKKIVLHFSSGVTVNGGLFNEDFNVKSIELDYNVIEGSD